MQITKKDLHEWIMNSTPVRYHNKVYKTFYNGREYFLFDHHTGERIAIYKKSRGVYGLESNKQ